MTAMTCNKTYVTVSQGETEVTGRRPSAYHRDVRYWTEQMLTKRRAVDFCRVAASLCRMA
ncbi:Ms5788A family Cys-rich leader peptide [Actinomadura macrotermitis]|uniref:Uncharacterized protein n=1 Tax=Actinomadura macrotermitis TaxID=2585200 RepID=A0A7K0BTJ5_9ACTN|nr:Ms5788A family Cys-rich leader peptide [Actinomadura macrotermitis]MQY04467.1 hypothetical protein [Actinomadura macrotermitis]